MFFDKSRISVVVSLSDNTDAIFDNFDDFHSFAIPPGLTARVILLFNSIDDTGYFDNAIDFNSCLSSTFGANHSAIIRPDSVWICIINLVDLSSVFEMFIM